MRYLDELKAKVKKGREVFIAPNATVIGDVELGNHVSVWFGAVIRGDNDKIVIGERSNIQDNCVLHVDEGDPVIIGREVTVGHGAIVHGATVGDMSLIGMGAIVLNKAKIGKCCIIGANALVTSGMDIPDYSLVMGSPAKIVKTYGPEVEERLRQSAENYVRHGKKYGSESI